MKKLFLLYIIIGGLTLSSCEDYLQKEPVDLIGDENVIEDLESLDAAVLGMYSSLQVDNVFGELHVFMPGILSDEMVFTGTFPTKSDMAVNNVTAENSTMRGAWSDPYITIFIANTILERGPSVGTEEEVAQSLAEAKFGRALAHFSLVRLWGAIPLALTSDVNITRALPRAPVSEVYASIIKDLNEAIPNLPAKSDEGSILERATGTAAQALLARAYLYNGDLSNAGSMADAVISSGEYSLDPVYSNIFSDQESSETIFRLFASISDQNSLGFYAQPTSLGGRYDYSPNPTLEAEIGVGDQRKAMIVANPDDGGILVTNKYTDANTGTDRPVLLRLAEMYLIRAEANSAVADLNAVSSMRGGATYALYTLDNMLQERKIELAFESHRWFDIARTGKADEIMSAMKPTSWTSTDILLPIPQRELEQNETLTSADQNPGY